MQLIYTCQYSSDHLISWTSFLWMLSFFFNFVFVTVIYVIFLWGVMLLDLDRHPGLLNKGPDQHTLRMFKSSHTDPILRYQPHYIADNQPCSYGAVCAERIELISCPTTSSGYVTCYAMNAGRQSFNAWG